MSSAATKVAILSTGGETRFSTVQTLLEANRQKRALAPITTARSAVENGSEWNRLNGKETSPFRVGGIFGHTKERMSALRSRPEDRGEWILGLDPLTDERYRFPVPSDEYLARFGFSRAKTTNLFLFVPHGFGPDGKPTIEVVKDGRDWIFVFDPASVTAMRIPGANGCFEFNPLGIPAGKPSESHSLKAGHIWRSNYPTVGIPTLGFPGMLKSDLVLSDARSAPFTALVLE